MKHYETSYNKPKSRIGNATMLQPKQWHAKSCGSVMIC